MKRQDVFKVFGISFKKYTMEDKLHQLMRSRQMGSLSNWKLCSERVGGGGGWLSKSSKTTSWWWSSRRMRLSVSINGSVMSSLIFKNQIRWASGKGKGKGKGDMMNMDYTELMDIHVNQNDLKRDIQMQMQMQSNNRELKEKMQDKLSKEELKIMKEGKDIKDIKDKSQKGIVKEIDKKSYLLETSFDIDSLPKISDGIINKDVIKDVPDNLNSFVPGEFNFNELDQKFSDFIKFLFISRKNITKKKFKFLVQGLFNI
jgi:hypothetical protein